MADGRCLFQMSMPVTDDPVKPVHVSLLEQVIDAFALLNLLALLATLFRVSTYISLSEAALKQSHHTDQQQDFQHVLVPCPLH